MKTKLLLTGASGLFGLNFLAKTKKNSQFAIFSERVDITKKKEIIKFIDEVTPDIIIHAASIGSVDYCEKNKKEAWITNVGGTRNIINGAKKTGTKLIFLSSNAVYDGKHPPYDEESLKKPVDFYGKTKVASENDITASGIPAVIARLMTMYGWHSASQRQNPVTWMIDVLSQKKTLQVVDDVYNNHLYVQQAVDCILQIIQSDMWGEVYDRKALAYNRKALAYNIAGRDSISRYQLALTVADVFSLDKKLIKPVSSDFFKTLAPRAKNTSFQTSKMQKELKVKPLGVREGLMLMKNSKLLL